MKKLRRACFLLLIFIVLLVAHGPCGAAAEFNHLGKFCFRMINIGDKDHERSLQLDLFSFSGQHYPVHGNVHWARIGRNIPVYGTAVKDGENVVISLTGSEYWDGSDAFTLHAVIGIDGAEYHTVEHGIRWIQPVTDIIVSFSDSGALTPSPCQ